MERDPLEVLTRPARPPDAVVRYADHSCGVIDLFLPPTFGHGSRSLHNGEALRSAAVGGETRLTELVAETDEITPLAARPCRLVVALHGGFWREKWDRTHLRPFATALVERGFVVATPEYRRGPGG
ncbi:MAG: hypothetical protein WAK18_07870 [Nocardioidaceae bacterium]